ncbi:MAG: hypothetical protein C0475_06855 [Planctomyces sp.]|nr:hypothetical protein [Planctomyces sp.]MBA4119881.1 hypothetical protein [Isosphaera sp.]
MSDAIKRRAWTVAAAVAAVWAGSPAMAQLVVPPAQSIPAPKETTGVDANAATTNTNDRTIDRVNLLNAEAIVDHYIGVIGGRQLAGSKTSRVAEGTYTVRSAQRLPDGSPAPGVTGSLTMYNAPDGRVKWEIAGPEFGAIELAYNGVVSYEYSKARGARLFEHDEHYDFVRSTRLYPELTTHLHAQGFATVSRRFEPPLDLWEVQYTPNEGKAYSVFYDETSKVIARDESVLDGVSSGNKTTRYSDYRPVDGVLVPHKTVITYDASSTEVEIVLSRVRWNVEIPESVFQLPADVLTANERRLEKARRDVEELNNHLKAEGSQLAEKLKEIERKEAEERAKAEREKDRTSPPSAQPRE